MGARVTAAAAGCGLCGGTGYKDHAGLSLDPCDHQAYSKLIIVPVTMKDANAFVTEHHRHHPGVRGCKFCIGVADETGRLRGVAVVGRPVARSLDDGFTAEVTRMCTDGARNACSMLYRAAWRASAAMGHKRMVTYTLATELGISLRAAGLRRRESVRGRSWDCPSRPRSDRHPVEAKWRWEICAGP
ncbi:XF1762 family protein [Novosphingobium sp. fls2-241-R2A-195]|uniref:XF1762 family protein n=1 Tax=Novosphingobium sp. fls2-241-R2A-195 TaxID=3040296 RepID=UPI0033056FE3